MNLTSTRAVLVGFALLASWVATGSLHAQSSAEVLAPGDAIQLVFWREPELDGDFPIAETGEAVLPILGAMSVAELSPADLRARLTAAYAKQLRNQQVQITLLRRVSVLGAVQEPGLYFVDPTMTVGDAVALAGGSSAQGKLDGIRFMKGDHLVRDGLDRDDLFDHGLFSGDRIYVPQRSWVSRHSTVLVGGILSATALVLTRVLIR